MVICGSGAVVGGTKLVTWGRGAVVGGIKLVVCGRLVVGGMKFVICGIFAVVGGTNVPCGIGFVGVWPRKLVDETLPVRVSTAPVKTPAGK